MPVSSDGFERYNAQASVDDVTALIVGQHFGQNPNDKPELKTALESLTTLLKSLRNRRRLVG